MSRGEDIYKSRASCNPKLVSVSFRDDCAACVSVG